MRALAGGFRYLLLLTTSVQANITHGQLLSIKALLIYMATVLESPGGGLSGTLSDLTQLAVPEMWQHKVDVSRCSTPRGRACDQLETKI